MDHPVMARRPRLVSFDQAVVAHETTPEPGRIVAGAPRLTAWNHYSEPGSRFFAGVWTATRGRWRIHYTEHEFCHLLAGRVVIESEDGERWEFGPGDSFVVPAGFAGSWEVLEDCRKLYAIFEAPA